MATPPIYDAAGAIMFFPVLVLFVLGAVQLLGPVCGQYRIDDATNGAASGGRIGFVWFARFHVWSCPLADIIDIKTISFGQLFAIRPAALNMVNRPFGRRYVLVRRRLGRFANVILTPDRPEDFVRLVRKAMENPPAPAPAGK